MFQPVFYLSNAARYFMLTAKGDVDDITDDLIELCDIPIVVISGENIPAFDSCMDLAFIRFCIENQNRQLEFSHLQESFSYCDRVCNHTSMIRPLMYHMQKIAMDKGIMQIFNKNRAYYNDVIRKMQSNVTYFNSVRIEVDDAGLGAIDVPMTHTYFRDGKRYLRPVFSLYGTSSNRLGSYLYPILNKIRSVFVPENDFIIEFDVVAAEFNYLLFLAGEQRKHELGTTTFWMDLCQLLGEPIPVEKLKGVIYMMLFGGGASQIAQKHFVTEEEIAAVKMELSRYYPHAYELVFGYTNKYFSKDAPTVYDFFGREKVPDGSYKKLNFLLQSSQSTYFQLFVYALREKLQQHQLRSKVLFTHHDAVYIDIAENEVSSFYEIFNAVNSAVQPKSRFRQRTITVRRE